MGESGMNSDEDEIDGRLVGGGDVGFAFDAHGGSSG
jgi:hypothetical protein